MTRIWRVENLAGSSPFTEPYFVNKFAANPSIYCVDRRNDFSHITDSLPWRRVRFGFTTKENLIDWFGYSLVLEFYEAGYKICSYIANQNFVCHSQSRYQLMFDMDNASFDFEVEKGELMRI